jgi:hypothetical protein
VTLLANRICLGQPGAKFGIHITWRGQPERMNVITRGDRLDLVEARVLKASRKHNMAVEPIGSRCDLRE